MRFWKGSSQRQRNVPLPHKHRREIGPPPIEKALEPGPTPAVSHADQLRPSRRATCRIRCTNENRLATYQLRAHIARRILLCFAPPATKPARSFVALLCWQDLV